MLGGLSCTRFPPSSVTLEHGRRFLHFLEPLMALRQQQRAVLKMVAGRVYRSTPEVLNAYSEPGIQSNNHWGSAGKKKQ